MKTHHLILGMIAWIPFVIAKIVLALLGPLFCLFIEKDHRPDILFIYHGGIPVEDWWWNYEQRLIKGPLQIKLSTLLMVLCTLSSFVAAFLEGFLIFTLLGYIGVWYVYLKSKPFGPLITLRKKDLWLGKHVWLRTWWWYAIRNPVEGWKKCFKHPEKFTEFNHWETARGKSNSPYGPKELGLDFSSVEPMESIPMLEAGIQEWSRWRRAGWRLSYRKLKLLDGHKYREIYFGWKLGSAPPDLDFAMQYREGRIGN